jgi:hypothetical protein
MSPAATSLWYKNNIMEITIHNQIQWNPEPGITHASVQNKWLSVLDHQDSNKTLWYIVSMVAQGVLFLPIPATLIYYFDAPLFLLPITLILFFSNIIGGMGGASIRFIVLLFLTSALIHIIMLSVYLL